MKTRNPSTQSTRNRSFGGLVLAWTFVLLAGPGPERQVKRVGGKFQQGGKPLFGIYRGTIRSTVDLGHQRNVAANSPVSSSPWTTAMNLSVLGWGRMSKKGLSMPVTHLMREVLPVLYLGFVFVEVPLLGFREKPEGTPPFWGYPIPKRDTPTGGLSQWREAGCISTR